MRSPRRQKTPAPCQEEVAADLVSQLYEQYSSRIAAYALRRTSRCDAGDVVAETFLVAWRKREHIPNEPMTLPWLYGVARRVLANQNRAHNRRSRLHERLTTHSLRQPATPRLEVAEGFEQVGVALSQLSTDDAEILRLTAWEDLSPCEIASVLNIEPAAVRQRLHRARKRLRNQLIQAEPVQPVHRPTTRPRRPLRSVLHQPIDASHLGSLGLGGGSHGR